MGQPLHYILAGIAFAQAPLDMRTKVIAVDGLGGAGKSTLATQLAAVLGAPVIHTDDFASWDDPLGWWPRLLEQVLDPLAHDQPAHYQRYNWGTKGLAEWIEVPPAEHIILEGVSASREAFQPHLAFSIWVETPREERLRRGLERDGAEALQLWEKWMEIEDEYVEREHPQRRADCVISGTSSG